MDRKSSRTTRQSRQPTDHTETTDDNVRARFFPEEFPAEVVLTDDDMVHLFTQNSEAVVPLETCEDIRAVIDHVREVTEATDSEDDVVTNLSAFTGIFRFLAEVGDNSYLNPPERTQTDYGVSEE